MQTHCRGTDTGWLLLSFHFLEEKGGAEQGDSGGLGQVHAWLPLLLSLLGGVM